MRHRISLFGYRQLEHFYHKWPRRQVNFFQAASNEEDADEELAPQTSDAISEAEIYIAYGRFPQAITFLQNAIDAEPGRADIQLKLLEVYVQTEDATAFNLQFDQLKMLKDEDSVARAEELQSQIPSGSIVMKFQDLMSYNLYFVLQNLKKD